MSRVKRGPRARRRRKKILKLAKGYWGARSKLWKTAVEAVHHAWLYQYKHRKEKKRTFARLWNIRIGAGASQHGLNYSKFIYGLKLAGVSLNRKILAELAVNDPRAFARLVEISKNHLPTEK